MSIDVDALHMRDALQCARRGLYTTDPNPRVGCVLVNDREVVARGWHAWAGEPHAEVQALHAAGGRARGATAYVTLEPCNHTGRTPPCTEALISAGVRRVVAASADPNTRVTGAGTARLQAAGIETVLGVLEQEARGVNPGFFSRFERARPFVRLKVGMSLDARTALANGRSQWITTEKARHDVQTYRAQSSAILTSEATVAADDPRLDVRLNYGPRVRQPLRIVLLSRVSRLPPGARIFHGDGPVLLMGTGAPPAGLDAQFERVDADDQGRPLIPHLLKRLAEHEVNELWVECGPRLAGEFIRSKCVDELILYIAPTLLGSDARPLIGELGLASLESAPRFEFASVERIGADLRCVLRLV